MIFITTPFFIIKRKKSKLAFRFLSKLYCMFFDISIVYIIEKGVMLAMF